MKGYVVLAIAVAAALCFGGCDQSACRKPQTNISMNKSDYYKDGKLDEVAAKKAYISMMENLGYPVSDNMRENMWVSDFGLGEFPAVGMGGIIWAMEDKLGVFGHDILLLPNKMLI